MEAEINKEFVFSHLAGRSSALQKQLLDAWVTTQNNEELFCQWVIEWELQQPQYVVNVSQALGRYQTRLDQQREAKALTDITMPEAPAGRRLFRPFFGWMAAAVVLLVVACGWAFRDAIAYQTYATGPARTSALQLADGSRITLHPNSTLRVPRFGFGRSSREVHLIGEARFAVTHTDDHQRFVVRTDEHLDVTVLGTEFTVYARPQGTKVVLDQGRVQLNFRTGSRPRQLTMKPGELVTLDPRSGIALRKTAEPSHHTVRPNHRYVFEETTVLELMYLLADRHGITAEVSDERLLNQTLSGSFTAENADELLNLLEEIMELQFNRRDDVVLISSNQEL